MLPIIARNLFRLQERMLGRDSFRILAELKKSERLPREEMRRLQLDRLQRLVRTAWEHTPYWRGDAGTGMSPRTCARSTRRFPSFKDVLRNRREEMVWRKKVKVQLVCAAPRTRRSSFISSTRRRISTWRGCGGTMGRGCAG